MARTTIIKKMIEKVKSARKTVVGIANKKKAKSAPKNVKKNKTSDFPTSFGFNLTEKKFHKAVTVRLEKVLRQQKLQEAEKMAEKFSLTTVKQNKNKA